MPDEINNLEKQDKTAEKGVLKLCIILCLAVLAALLCKTAYAQYQIFDFQKRYKEAPAGNFIETGKLNLPRSSHSAVQLNNGSVLIIGGNKGAELFNPKTGQYKLINKTLPEFDGYSLNSVKLPDGRVLTAGYYIYDADKNIFYTVQNAEKFIPKDILRYDASIPFIMPVVLSDSKVLLIPSWHDDSKTSYRAFVLNTNTNAYESLNINIENHLKKFLSHGLSYFKKDNFIYFSNCKKDEISIIKWDYIKNKSEEIKHFNVASFYQTFILDENTVLFNDKQNLKMYDIKNDKLSDISKSFGLIYSIFKSEKDNCYDIFAGTGNITDTNERYLRIVSFNPLSGIDYKYASLPKAPDYYIQCFEFNDNLQSITSLGNGEYLISGGQLALPVHTRINFSEIIKL